MFRHRLVAQPEEQQVLSLSVAGSNPAQPSSPSGERVSGWSPGKDQPRENFPLGSRSLPSRRDFSLARRGVLEEERMKRCPRCKTEKPKTEFHKNRHNRDGLGWWCIACRAEYDRSEYRKRYFREYQAAHRETMNARRRRNGQQRRERTRDKRRVHAKVYNAIKYGRIERPGKCSRCGTQCKPEGHHDDYSKPLEISWLCQNCHLAYHDALRAFGLALREER